MKPSWEIKDTVLERWRQFVEENSPNKLVIERQRRNLKRIGINLSKQYLWEVFVGCQVTTQQRSGPGTPVSRFLQSASLALDYSECVRTKSLNDLLLREFSAAGLRRSVTMASNLTSIQRNLEDGEWKTLLKQLETLKSNTTKGKEDKVSRYLQSKIYPGLGPKQSRNFIQWIGLSRYVIPLDSRVLRKLKEFGCTFVPRASALSDETVYGFVQSGVQEIASKLDIYPCILDACIFSSFDKD